MALGIRQTFKIFAPGGSLQRRVAYSLVIVRLILVPVILLAVYYLFAMGRIVDRIVSVDAPATTMSEQASVEMLEARRAERNYFLLRDPAYLEANRTSIAKTRSTLIGIQNLAPSEQPEAQKALDELHLYQQRFEAAVSILGAPGRAPSDRIQAVIRTYEKDLDGLLTQARSRKRAQLVDELRRRVDSFDVQILKTVQEQDPELRQATVDLENSSQEILRRTWELESRSWKRVQEDHRHIDKRVT
jgi:CHASE3 domain sensor protein